MMNLLKQWIYSPVTVAKQVCSIYAGSKWFLDKIDSNKVWKFEEELYSKLDEEKTILEDITKNKMYSDNSIAKLEKIVKSIVEINK
jgi:F-type H+-transporting ATPase subunit alpha